MSRPLVPAFWSTDRLDVRNVGEHDLPEMRAVLAEVAYVDELTGYREESKDPVADMFEGKSLPPDGMKELQGFQAIVERSSGAIIGHLVGYHGYPDPDTYWIAAFAIRPAFQRKGYGTEFVDGLTAQVKALGAYSKMGIGVLVGNDVGEKFWASCGFTNHVKTEDHGTYVTKRIIKDI